MKLLRFITATLILLLLFMLLSREVGAGTRSYLVTEGGTFQPAAIPGANLPVLVQVVTLDYSLGGKILISSNPDGTGDMNVGDGIVLYDAPTGRAYNYAASTDCIHFNSIIPPTDITSYRARNDIVNFTFVFQDRCGRVQTLGKMYVVHTGLPGPDPFLDLPWDYEGKGLSFTEAALSMSSYFDHEYPLLGSTLNENFDHSKNIIKYDGNRTNDQYSSHNGYDWAKTAEASFGDPVLAAAAGEATYINSCGACGNMILVDHNNGYQTRYLHLQKDGLITNVPGEKVVVQARQPIGRVGSTGNVIPAGDAGAHIHFGVVQDKNNDGNFTDDQPWGLTDPFGWKSISPDPWELYSTTIDGEVKTGNKSYYLWLKSLLELKTTLNANGGTFTNGKYSISFPKFAVNQDVTLHLQSMPRIKIGENQETVGTSLFAQVIHANGSLIKTFSKPFTLVMDFIDHEIAKYRLETISIYSSEDGMNWKKETTTIDWENKQAVAVINHMSYFALVAEKKDTAAPVTSVSIDGTLDEDNIYTSPITLTLHSSDELGSGVEYTQFRLSNSESDWQQYTQPVTISDNGIYTVEFYSEDTEGNVENLQSVQFEISQIYDYEAPEIVIAFNPESKQLLFTPSEPVQYSSKMIRESDVVRTFTDLAGNTLTVITREDTNNKSIRFMLNSLQYNNETPIFYEEEKQKYSMEIDLEDITKLKQVFQSGDDKVSLAFKGKTNSTVIHIVEGEVSTKFVLEGMPLLKISTEKGTLKYSY